MKESLKNRVVLVTGSSRGIGRATAERFAEKGAKVVICARDPVTVKDALTDLRIRFPGGSFLAEAVDLGDVGGIRALFIKIDRVFGSVDILINNGAIGYQTPFLEITEESWNPFFDINVRGLFFCAQESMKRMIADKKSGLIVNISSLGGIRGTEKFPGLAPYVASKFAVTGLTESLAVEGEPYGIRVIGIAPGAVNTKMLETAAPELKSATEADDIAKLIIDMCEDSASSPSGTILEVHSNL